MSKISIVFFGTPDIGLKSLEHLYNSDKIDVLAVVTQPDKPAGRGHKIQMPPIKQFAIEKNIPVFQPKSIRKEPEIIEELKKLQPDFFVTFAFGQNSKLSTFTRLCCQNTEGQTLFKERLSTATKKQVFVQ